MGVYLGRNAVEVYGGGVKVKPEEEKTVTASTSAIEVTPTSGKTLKKVTVNPTPSEEKTVTPSASQQIVIPSDGKLLSQVTVGKAVYPTGIAITTPPIKNEYLIYSNLDLSGMVVTGTFDNGVVVDITDDCTFTPANGTALTIDDTSVTVSFSWGGKTYTTSQAITVKMYEIVTWAAGTDEQIVGMVAAADRGEINLADYWAVGDERQVTLSAMDATGVDESHDSQTVTLVLMHQGGYELADGKTCSFVVGQKNTLKETGYMHSNTTNNVSWNGCKRRAWCNSVYYNAYPETLRPIFKQFKTIAAETYNGTNLKTSIDYFALHASAEVEGTSVNSTNTTEANALTQLDYYKNIYNHNKLEGDSGAGTCNWWTRSISSYSDSSFVYIEDHRTYGASQCTTYCGISPFGCI